MALTPARSGEMQQMRTLKFAGFWSRFARANDAVLALLEEANAERRRSRSLSPCATMRWMILTGLSEVATAMDASCCLSFDPLRRLSPDIIPRLADIREAAF